MSPTPSGPSTNGCVISEPSAAKVPEASLPVFNAQEPVRRPVRGLQLKGETFARIGLPQALIADSSGKPADPKRADGENTPGEAHYVGRTKKYANFLLQSMTMDMEEKFQPVPTFGLTYGFFFGERPHIYSFNAVLVDSGDFRWVSDWLGNYETLFRGTQLARANTPVTVEVEDHVIEGYLIRSTLTKDANTPLFMQLGFTMWVTSHTTPQHGAGDTRFPLSAGGTAITHQTPFSTTDAVRRANISRLQSKKDTGWLRKVINAISALREKYDNVVQKIENFLYNRNIVPANQYVSQDRVAAESRVFAEILNGKPAQIFSRPVPYLLHSKGFIFENRDEYLLGGWIDASESLAAQDPDGLRLANGKTTVQALLTTASAAWAVKAQKEPVTLNSESLLEKIGRVVLSRAALYGAQVLLQEDGIVALTSGSVDGTMLGRSDKLKFKTDILVPSLHTIETLAIDAVGARTLTDRLRTQAQSREQLQRQQAAVRTAATTASRARTQTEQQQALQEASAAARELDRTVRLQALQNAANDLLGSTASGATSEAALQEQITAARAEERRQQQLAEAARNAEREALLRAFAS